MRSCAGSKFRPRIPYIDHGIHLELSAFLTIAWYTYRNKSALKFSALVRTIAAEATVYFLVMVAAQVYIQLSLTLMEVYSFVSLLHFVVIDREYSRVSRKNFRSCEYATNSNRKDSQLIVPTLRPKCIWTVRLHCRHFVTGGQAHLIFSLNPILTMRFAVSLKRSADPDGGQEWQLSHFSSVGFGDDTSPDIQVAPVRDNIEMDPIYPPNEQIRTCYP